MNTHPTEQDLYDYTDGTLEAARAPLVARHLEQCDTCRLAAVRQRALLQQISALPREIAPPPAVLREIQRALRADGAAVAPVPARRVRARDWSVARLAAAAVLLVALSSAVTALLVLRYAAPAGVVREDVSAPAPAGAVVALNALEDSYMNSIAELERALREYEHVLAPETVRLIRTNLDVVDRALADARAALREDPADATLVDLLRANYERKRDVLRSASSYAATRL